MSPLLFIHIPKTAGTSFRLGAENFFSKSRIVYDYGKSSPVTSKLTQEQLYSLQGDFWKFGQECNHKNVAMVGGHFNVGRFVSVLGVDRSVTFLREPLQRMASEYAHFIRNYGYKGSFRDFYTPPIIHNRQSKSLHGVNIEALGFAGLTERYEDSLAVLNTRYGIGIEGRQDNRGKKSLDSLHEISEEDEVEFKRLNKRDIKLYNYAAALFDQRYHLHQEKLPWAHARLQEVSVQKVVGWAWWEGRSNEPVSVEVWVNDELTDTVNAVNLRPGLCRLLPPRGGYVGFQLPVKLAAGDRVQCRVARTGQRFPLTPSRVPKPEAK